MLYTHTNTHTQIYGVCVRMCVCMCVYKTMRVSRKGSNEYWIEGQGVEQVTKFKYLGGNITENGRCETEIKTRIGMAKDAFGNRRSY